MNLKFIFPALMLCLGILNGCGAARPSKFYQLTIPSDKTPGADPAPFPVTLLLGPITTSHLYRDDHIVYTSNGEAMGTYEYQRWAEPPSEMIGDVEFELRDLKTGATVWSRSYSHDEPVSSKDVPAVVAALNRNVQSGLGEVVRDLEQYFSGHTQTTAAAR
jgi:ABC-type uncharacterized transport system auxiliary subunit